MSSSSSPCAACKLQRRKCTQECIFAPYFPADQPQKFANIHKVFGASNVAKILNEIDVSQREETVNSLAYEADMRQRDPIYGPVGHISLLQQKLKFMQSELSNAKKELAAYIGPQALLPIIQPQQPTYIGNPAQFMGGGGVQMMAPHQGGLMIREQTPQAGAAAVAVHHHQQQAFEAQQLAAAVAAREQQEMYHRQQQDMKFNGGFDIVSDGVGGGHGYDQGNLMGVSPSLVLGGPFDGKYQIQGPPAGDQQQPHNHHHLQGHHLSLQPQQQGVTQPEHHERSGSEEKCNGGLSS